MSRAQRGLRARRPESLFTVTPVAEVLDLDRNPVTSNRDQIRHCCWLYRHSSSSDDSVKDKEVTRLLLVKTLSLLLVVDKPACPLYVSSCGSNTRPGSVYHDSRDQARPNIVIRGKQLFIRAHKYYHQTCHKCHHIWKWVTLKCHGGAKIHLLQRWGI